MKNLLLTTALAAGFALPVMAQDAASPFQTEAAGPSISASDVIGARVYASEGAVDADAYSGVQEGWNDIGEVNDIILGRDGTVDAVLVDIGGFLGIGERKVAVDMSALKVVQDDATDADDWFLVLQADRATLDAAPEYVLPGADMKASNDTDGAAATDTTAATDGTAATDTTAATDGTAATDSTAATDGTAATDTTAATDGTAATDTTTQGTATDTAVEQSATADGTEGAGNATDTALPADGDGTTQNATAADNGTMAMPEGFTEVGRDTLTAETLTGADVRDQSDQSIAEVSDLVLTAEGQVTDVVLDVGGFLGIGARSVAIPMDRLIVGQNEGGAIRIWVNMTKEELEALPEHKM